MATKPPTSITLSCNLHTSSPLDLGYHLGGASLKLAHRFRLFSTSQGNQMWAPNPLDSNLMSIPFPCQTIPNHLSYRSHTKFLEIVATNRKSTPGITELPGFTSNPSSLGTQKVQFSQFRMKVEELHGLAPQVWGPKTPNCWSFLLWPVAK